MSAYIMKNSEIYFLAFYAKTNTYNYLDNYNFADIAQILFAENLKSVNFRYKENQNDKIKVTQKEYDNYYCAFKIQKDKNSFDSKIANLLLEYEYQACEHDTFRKSFAFEILGYINHAITKKISDTGNLKFDTTLEEIEVSNKNFNLKWQTEIAKNRYLAEIEKEMVLHFDCSDFSGYKMRLSENKFESMYIQHNKIERYFYAEPGDIIKLEYSDYIVSKFTKNSVFLTAQNEYSKNKIIDLKKFVQFYINEVVNQKALVLA